MVSKYIYILLALIFMSSPIRLRAQKDQIPLQSRLTQSSERLLIKIGAVSKKKPAKLKFGSYATVNQKGISIKDSDNAPGGKTELDFSFVVIHKKADSAFVEAVKNSSDKEDGKTKDLSVYITTNIDQEDLWVLLMTQTPDKNEFSLENIFLTNGTDEISFENVMGDPMGKSEVTAPKGIIALINGNAIGAMQYYSGGSFSYKKFIWISDEFDPQLKMIVAAVFSSMMEVAGYFEDATITD